MSIEGAFPGDGLFPTFSQAEFDRRHRAVREAMERDGIEALLISGPGGNAEVPYLINYVPQSPTWLVFPRQGDSTCFTHFFNHLPCAKEQAIIEDIRWGGPNAVESVANLLHERGLAGARLGVVSFASVSHAQFTDLQKRLPNAELVDFGGPFTRIRLVRSDEELAFLRRSGYLTDLTCEALERELRPGMTEHEIKAIIYNAYLKDGGDPGIHFIATTNMNAPDRFVPWQRTTSRAVTTGSVVITEITVGYWGYSTQIHRPFAIGQEPPKVYRELFDAALECYENIRRVCRPGATSEDIINASSVIEERGFTSFDSVFHGERGRGPELGTPSAAHPPQQWTLTENMIHVIQPNPITKDRTAGLQLGAAVVVTPNGGEPLHNYPFKFTVCRG